jgi:BlaI family transcriptional regulator, penicillinase repressor
MLNAVWALGDCTVRELVERQKPKMPYTTAMTTLDRLYHKQILSRVAEGRAFRYKPRLTREDLRRAEVKQTIRELLRPPFGAAMPLSYLVEAISEHDAQLLDELQRQVAQKRIKRSRL